VNKADLGRLLGYSVPCRLEPAVVDRRSSNSGRRESRGRHARDHAACEERPPTDGSAVWPMRPALQVYVVSRHGTAPLSAEIFRAR